MGPIFGGFLGAVDFGPDGLESWRLIFFVIAGLGGLLWIISVFGLKETLTRDPSEPVGCVNPVSPIAFMRYFRISTILLSLSIGFAGFFAINISFPMILQAAYNQPTLTVGLCYLPFGVGLVIGAVVGGRSADRMRRRGGTAEHRLLPSLLFFPLNACFIVGQGWIFDYADSIHLSVVLIMSFFLGFTFILPRAGVNTYVIEKLKLLEGRDLASSATGLVFGVMLPVSAIIAQLSVIGFGAIGYGRFLTIVGGVLFASTIPIAIFVIRDIRKAKRNANSAGSPSSHKDVDYQAIN